MLTKGAIGNLINRYRAVLTKCTLINTFGSLAVASMLVLGGAGMAVAADYDLQGKGVAGDTYNIDDNIISGWLVKGAELPKASATSSAFSNAGITTEITGKNVSEIIGGSYAKGTDFGDTVEVEHGAINLTIGGGTAGTPTAAEFVVGGSKIANKNNANLKTGDITLNIGSGEFGSENDYELVTGGNYIKAAKNAGYTNTANAENVIVNIEGGTFGATVVGGSTAHEYSRTKEGTANSLTVTDKSTAVNITGGTFTPSKHKTAKGGGINLSAAVIGGGLAYGEATDSTAGIASTVSESSSVNLEGGTVTGKVVAGGYATNGGTANIGDENNDISGDTHLTMTNGTVKGDLVGGGLVDGTIISKGRESKASVYGSTYVTVNGGALEGAEIIGGGYVRNGKGEANVGGDTNVTVTAYKQTELGGQNWVQYVIGGGKAMTQYEGDTATADVKGTANVTIGENTPDGTEINFGSVIGGGLARAQGKGGTATATVDITKVTVNGGTLSGVTGGGVAEALGSGNATASVTESTLTINGGTINGVKYKGDEDGSEAAVIGGGIAYAKSDGSASANVTTAKTVINDGQINGNVYAGGMAHGAGTEANVTTADLTLNGGTINGSVYASGYAVDQTNADNAAVEDATINITGDVTIGETLNADGATLNIETDKFTVGQSSSIEDTAVNVGAEANDALNGSPKALADKLKVTEDELKAAKSFSMAEGLIADAVTLSNGKFVSKANTVLRDMLEMSTTAQLAVNRVLMNDVRKRMGDLRDSAEDAGVWMRWDGGKLKGDSGLSNDFNTVQVGADMLTGIKNVRAGVAAAFTHGDIGHSNGNGEMEAYSFSAYGTWMAENGMFADVVARVGFANTDLTVKGYKAELDNEVLSLSGEYGWRLPICSQFYVEPQVELTYTYVTSDDSKVDYASLKIDSVDSLLGRAGAVFGWNLPDNRGSLYARASVVHEFLADSKITGYAYNNTKVRSLDGEDTWLEYGLGANIKLTDSTYLWADVERTEGAEIDEEWRGTVGVRFSF